MNRDDMKKIIQVFASSNWDLIAKPSNDWLVGKNNQLELIQAVEQANKECGSCGCEWDALYKQVLANTTLL